MCANCLVSLSQNDKRQIYALSLGDPICRHCFKFTLVLTTQVHTFSCRSECLSVWHHPWAVWWPLLFLPSVSWFLRLPPPPSQFPSCLSKNKGPFFSLSWCPPPPGSSILVDVLTFLHLGLLGPGCPGIYRANCSYLLLYRFPTVQRSFKCFLFFDPKVSTLMVWVFLSWENIFNHVFSRLLYVKIIYNLVRSQYPWESSL